MGMYTPAIFVAAPAISGAGAATILTAPARIIAAAATDSAGAAMNIAGEFTKRFASCMNEHPREARLVGKRFEMN